MYCADADITHTLLTLTYENLSTHESISHSQALARRKVPVFYRVRGRGHRPGRADAILAQYLVQSLWGPTRRLQRRFIGPLMTIPITSTAANQPGSPAGCDRGR